MSIAPFLHSQHCVPPSGVGLAWDQLDQMGDPLDRAKARTWHGRGLGGAWWAQGVKCRCRQVLTMQVASSWFSPRPHQASASPKSFGQDRSWWPTAKYLVVPRCTLGTSLLQGGGAFCDSCAKCRNTAWPSAMFSVASSKEQLGLRL
jgi:hypothetical protein